MENTALVLMSLLFLFAFLPVSVGKKQTFGFRWLASNRNPIEGRELPRWAQRCERAHQNLKDNFPAFVAAILLLIALDKTTELTGYLAIAYVFSPGDSLRRLRVGECDGSISRLRNGTRDQCISSRKLPLMLYSLLTKNEIEKIKAILDRENIAYRVLINEELIQEQNEEMKYVLNRHGDIRRTDAFYNLIIEGSEFSRISKEGQLELERFNIFPELTDVPFEAESHEIDLRPPLRKKRSMGEKILALLSILMLSFLAYSWIDNYVIKTFNR